MMYKGFYISVEVTKNSNGRVIYIAKAVNGSDSAHGDTPEDAIKHLKDKIDNISAWHAIYSLPLQEWELNALINRIKGSDEIWIRRKLTTIHYIIQDECGINYRAMLNHYKDIEKALNECDNNFNLDILQIDHIDGKSFLIIYDKDCFNTTSSIYTLYQKLRVKDRD